MTQYSLAIDALPSAILYSNRAMAYLKLEDFGLAIDDANTGFVGILANLFVKRLISEFCSYFVGCNIYKILLQVFFCVKALIRFLIAVNRRGSAYFVLGKIKVLM